MTGNDAPYDEAMPGLRQPCQLRCLHLPAMRSPRPADTIFDGWGVAYRSAMEISGMMVNVGFGQTIFYLADSIKKLDVANLFALS